MVAGGVVEKGIISMVAGVSTACLYPEYTEKNLMCLAELGVAVSEVFINSALELEEQYVRKLRHIADGAGMRVSSVHPHTGAMEPFLFFSRYERRFEEGLELFRRYYHAAAELGARIVIFHGNSRLNRIEPDDYFERFLRLHTEAKRFGVELCQENVERCDSRSPDFFSLMSQAIPDARFVFDIKQALRAEEDVMRFAQGLGGRIAHIHLSDHNDHKDCLLPCSGTFNTAEFLETMRKLAPCSDVIVEVYRENFGSPVEIKSSYQQLYAMLST